MATPLALFAAFEVVFSLKSVVLMKGVGISPRRLWSRIWR